MFEERLKDISRQKTRKDSLVLPLIGRRSKESVTFLGALGEACEIWFIGLMKGNPEVIQRKFEVLLVDQAYVVTGADVQDFSNYWLKFMLETISTPIQIKYFICARLVHRSTIKQER